MNNRMNRVHRTALHRNLGASWLSTWGRWLLAGLAVGGAVWWAVERWAG